MSGPKAAFAALAASAVMTAQAAPPPAAPMSPQAQAMQPASKALAQMTRDNLTMLDGLTADKSSECADLASAFKSYQGILDNQRNMYKVLPGANAVLDAELATAKVPEAFKDSQGKIEKRCGPLDKIKPGP